MTVSPFDARSINSYTEGPPRQVPGFTSLHRMVSILLAERTPPNGRLLVLGAGGGLELKALAETHSEWHSTAWIHQLLCPMVSGEYC